MKTFVAVGDMGYTIDLLYRSGAPILTYCSTKAIQMVHGRPST